jgi:transposase
MMDGTISCFLDGRTAVKTPFFGLFEAAGRCGLDGGLGDGGSIPNGNRFLRLVNLIFWGGGGGGGNLRGMSFLFHVGIDISKRTLDVAVLRVGRLLLSTVIDNSEGALMELLVMLRQDHGATADNTVFCAEHMGIYANFLREVMVKRGRRLCLESPLRIKLSLGIQRGKSDAVDAVRIAEYAWRYSDRLEIWSPPRAEILRLRMLMAIRRRLIKMGAMLKSPRRLEAYYLTGPARKEVGGYSKGSYAAIKADIKRIDAEVEGVLKGDERLAELLRVITSVPSIGVVIATEIIIHTNEFKEISSAKKFASYCGIAPFARSSGTSLRTRPRISPIAHRDLKTMLHLASMGATRRAGSAFSVYYERKVAEGKNKMSVLNALRNKLVAVIFACVRDNRCFREPGGG